MSAVARTRLFVARHPSVRWLVVGSLALAVASGVHRQLADLDTARREWGERRQVFVADIDHHPDDRLSVSRVALPVAAVPASAVTELPAEARLRQHVAAGEILVEADLAGGGPAGRADPGTVVVPIADRLAPDAPIGVQVRVMADGAVLARHGRVVGVADAVIQVAVDETDAALVAAAARDDRASVGFLP